MAAIPHGRKKYRIVISFPLIDYLPMNDLPRWNNKNALSVILSTSLENEVVSTGCGSTGCVSISTVLILLKITLLQFLWRCRVILKLKMAMKCLIYSFDCLLWWWWRQNLSMATGWLDARSCDKIICKNDKECCSTQEKNTQNSQQHNI